MGLISNEHGVWIVRRKVPNRLQEPVARVLNNGKDRQTFLQKSTGTKDKKEATRLAPVILVEFGKILDEAEALLAERPLRTSLALSEIDRIAAYHYASVLVPRASIRPWRGYAPKGRATADRGQARVV
jgi:hypothetical protein